MVRHLLPLSCSSARRYIVPTPGTPVGNMLPGIALAIAPFVKSVQLVHQQGMATQTRFLPSLAGSPAPAYAVVSEIQRLDCRRAGYQVFMQCRFLCQAMGMRLMHSPAVLYSLAGN